MRWGGTIPIATPVPPTTAVRLYAPRAAPLDPSSSIPIPNPMFVVL